MMQSTSFSNGGRRTAAILKTIATFSSRSGVRYHSSNERDSIGDPLTVPNPTEPLRERADWQGLLD